MRKRNPTPPTYEHCSICYPTDDEVIAITDALLHRVLACLDQLKKREDTDPLCSKLESLDFNKLVKMIFRRRFKSLKATHGCRHGELKRYCCGVIGRKFIEKTGCNEKQIDRISGVISWKIAKFQYHTDVIVSQSKSFLRHFVQGDDSKASTPSSNRVKQTSLSANINQVKQQQEQPLQVHPQTPTRNPRNLQQRSSVDIELAIPKPTNPNNSNINNSMNNKIGQEGSIFGAYPLLWQVTWPTHMLFPTQAVINNEGENQGIGQGSGFEGREV